MTETNPSTTRNEPVTTSDESLVQNPIDGGGELVDYDLALLANSDADNNILFFHADWCSVCNAVERNLTAGNIPDGTRIFKVDYESSEGRDLAEKYDIPIQYSMVQVDTDGSEITQWVNQSFFTIEDVLERVQAT